jgi:hypothetical protein
MPDTFDLYPTSQDGRLIYAVPARLSAEAESVRFCLPAAMARYLSWAFHRDHARAAFRHWSPQ